MRHLRRALLVLFLLVHLAVPASAESEIEVLMNEGRLHFDVPPAVQEGRTLVPLRALAEALGYEVAYDPGERRISLASGEKTIVLWVESRRVLVDGKESELDVPATVRGGRTLVPLRFVAERLGADVQWDGTARVVTVTSPGYDLLKRTLDVPAVLPDQTVTGRMDMAMAGKGPGGEDMSQTMAMEFTTQWHKGDMLTTGTITVPTPTGQASIPMQVAARGGQMYMLDASTGRWQHLGSFDPGKLPGLGDAAGLPGMPDLTRLQADIFRGTRLKVLGTEVLDGVTTVRMEADVARGFQAAMHEAMTALEGMLPRGAEVPKIKVEVPSFKVGVWIGPANGFIYRTVQQLAFILSIDSTQASAAMHLTMNAEINSRPGSEPIKFPDLPAAQN